MEDMTVPKITVEFPEDQHLVNLQADISFYISALLASIESLTKVQGLNLEHTRVVLHRSSGHSEEPRRCEFKLIFSPELPLNSNQTSAPKVIRLADKLELSIFDVRYRNMREIVTAFYISSLQTISVYDASSNEAYATSDIANHIVASVAAFLEKLALSETEAITKDLQVLAAKLRD